MLANTAKLAMKGIMPQEAMPAATPVISCSAMPQSKYRSGNASIKGWKLTETAISEPTIAMRLSFFASSTISFPTATLFAIIPFLLLILS